MSDLRSHLETLEKTNQLLHIEDELSVEYEISAFLKAFNGRKALYFEKIKGFHHSVVGGVCGTRHRIYQALGTKKSDFYTKLEHAIKKPIKTEIASTRSVLKDMDSIRLHHIPILTHYTGDPSPYITSAIIYAQSPDETISNVSIHRLQVLDDKHLAIRIVPRQLYRICQLAKEVGQQYLEISISIGLHPALLLAASSPVPYGISEFDVANALLGGQLKLFRCPHVNAYAPTTAELVLEGQILLDREVIEGPFVDLTSTFDIQRKQYPVKILGVMGQKDFLYQALLPAGAEHVLLMGMPQEVRIWNYARNINPTVKAVNMTHGGRGWLHCVVSFDKFKEGDGKNVLLAIFAANPSIKHAIVVDSDIDVFDMDQVEWALATRFRGDTDLLIIPNVRVSSLDPTSDQERELGCKVGFDATKPLSKPQEKFVKAKIPLNTRVKTLLNTYNIDLENFTKGSQSNISFPRH